MGIPKKNWFGTLWGIIGYIIGRKMVTPPNFGSWWVGNCSRQRGPIVDFWMLLTIGYIEKNKQIKQCYNIHEHTYRITLQKEF
jgi:hypothetical protein